MHNESSFVSLVVKGKSAQPSKSLKILWTWLSAKFFPAFYVLSTASVVKNSHILAGIYFIFLKNVLDQAWKVFNAKFGPQQKDRGSSYQVRQILALFYKLVAPILGFKCVKDLRFAKVIKQIKFEGVWGKLKVFHKIFEKSSSFHVK